MAATKFSVITTGNNPSWHICVKELPGKHTYKIAVTVAKAIMQEVEEEEIVAFIGENYLDFIRKIFQHFQRVRIKFGIIQQMLCVIITEYSQGFFHNALLLARQRSFDKSSYAVAHKTDNFFFCFRRQTQHFERVIDRVNQINAAGNNGAVQIKNHQIYCSHCYSPAQYSQLLI